jgi:hypothetical protein
VPEIFSHFGFASTVRPDLQSAASRSRSAPGRPLPFTQEENMEWKTPVSAEAKGRLRGVYSRLEKDAIRIAEAAAALHETSAGLP